LSPGGANDTPLRGDPALQERVAFARALSRAIPGGRARARRFSVAIDGPDGVAVWAGPGRRDGDIVVAGVPGQLLPPGRYAVELSGVGLGSGPEVLHRYAVRVTP